MTTFVHNGKAIKQTKRIVIKKVFDEIFINLHRYIVVKSDGVSTSEGEWTIQITVLSMREIKQKYILHSISNKKGVCNA